MHMITDITPRHELEAAILAEPELLAVLDYARFMGQGYSTDALRAIIVAWIAAGDETEATP